MVVFRIESSAPVVPVSLAILRLFATTTLSSGAAATALMTFRPLAVGGAKVNGGNETGDVFFSAGSVSCTNISLGGAV